MAEGTQRRLAAIVSVDVVGYSRLIGADEAGTLAALRAHRKELIDPLIIIEHSGRIVKTMGDGLLLEFQSVVNATQCAIEIQSAMAERNQAIDEERRITFRIGINLGDIVIEGEDIHGDGVNVAARLQEACWPGGLALSGLAYESFGNLINAQFEDSGQQNFKNIIRPIQVWRWSPAMQPRIEAAAIPPALPDKPSIAVLPFENMSGDSEQEYFADGIAEDVITALSRFGSLFVIARNSSFTYKGTATDVTRVAHDLGVRYVVEGSVRRARNRVRITAQLVDATSGKHLWADRFDGHLDDVFELQDKITEQIVVAVEPEIGTHERELARRRPPGSLDAWELVQRGLTYFYGKSRSDQIEAINCFKKATSVDPEFALAHAQLAHALCVGVTSGFVDDQPKAINSARAEAEQALVLDSNEPMAHYALGRAHILEGETEPAIAEMQTAISINPNFASAYYGLGYTHYYSAGEAELALPHFDNALRLSPRDPMRWGTLMNKGSVLRILGRHDEAISYCRQACQFLNGGYLPHMHLGAALAAAGREDEATLAVKKAKDLNPELSVSYIRDRFVKLHESVMNGLAESLAKAGLPETLDPKTEAEILTLPDKPSIAVLPFENMSGDPEQEYFADGITEDIITALSRVGWFFVIARNSSFAYKGRSVDVRQIARALGVRYILEGSVRKVGHRVRITAQLIDAVGGKHLWADRYDGKLEDVFDLQDRVTESVVGAVEPKLRLTEIDRAIQKRPANLDAYDYLLRALPHIAAFSNTELLAARQLLDKAVEFEPRYAAGLAYAAWCRAFVVFFGWSADPETDRAEGLRLAQSALASDPEDATALRAAGWTKVLVRDHDAALKLIDKSLEVDANSALAWGLRGWINLWYDRTKTAKTDFETAVRLSPFDTWSSFYANGMAYALTDMGKCEEALPWARDAVQTSPEWGSCYRVMAYTLISLGRLDEARAIAHQFIQFDPDFTLQSFDETAPFVDKMSESYRRFRKSMSLAGMPEGPL